MRSRLLVRILGVAVFVAFFTTVAQASVLYQEDFSKESAIQGYEGHWEDGGASGSGAGQGAFHIADGMLDGGNGDTPSASLVRWLTGDTAWADVKVTSHIRVNGQDTGWVAILARYKDPSNWYALRYSTGEPTQQLPGDQPPAGSPSLQIVKMLNGRLFVLAETTENLPAINGSGDDNAQGADFTLTVKGRDLSAAVNGKTLLTASDPSLSSGQIGFAQQEYYPLWQNIIVETP
ncbi:MAG TPA: hypothetical protein VFK80_06245 [Limnochordia bacterium]|nr:hypothetical protein [Limnochordia bacterium]